MFIHYPWYKCSFLWLFKLENLSSFIPKYLCVAFFKNYSILLHNHHKLLKWGFLAFVYYLSSNLYSDYFSCFNVSYGYFFIRSKTHPKHTLFLVVCLYYSWNWSSSRVFFVCSFLLILTFLKQVIANLQVVIKFWIILYCCWLCRWSCVPHSDHSRRHTPVWANIVAH